MHLYYSCCVYLNKACGTLLINRSVWNNSLTRRGERATTIGGVGVRLGSVEIVKNKYAVHGEIGVGDMFQGGSVYGL